MDSRAANSARNRVLGGRFRRSATDAGARMPPRSHHMESADVASLAGNHTKASPIRGFARVSVRLFARSRWTGHPSLACNATVVHACMDETGDCCPLTSWCVAHAWKGSTSMVNTNGTTIDRTGLCFSAGSSSSRARRWREPSSWKHRRLSCPRYSAKAGIFGPQGIGVSFLFGLVLFLATMRIAGASTPGPRP